MRNLFLFIDAIKYNSLSLLCVGSNGCFCHSSLFFYRPKERLVWRFTDKENFAFNIYSLIETYKKLYNKHIEGWLMIRRSIERIG